MGSLVVSCGLTACSSMMLVKGWSKMAIRVGVTGVGLPLVVLKSIVTVSLVDDVDVVRALQAVGLEVADAGGGPDPVEAPFDVLGGHDVVGAVELHARPEVVGDRVRADGPRLGQVRLDAGAVVLERAVALHGEGGGLQRLVDVPGELVVLAGGQVGRVEGGDVGRPGGGDVWCCSPRSTRSTRCLPCWEQAARATAGRRATIASALGYFGGANRSRLGAVRGTEGMADQNSLLDCVICLSCQSDAGRGGLEVVLARWPAVTGQATRWLGEIAIVSAGSGCRRGGPGGTGTPAGSRGAGHRAGDLAAEPKAFVVAAVLGGIAEDSSARV